MSTNAYEDRNETRPTRKRTRKLRGFPYHAGARGITSDHEKEGRRDSDFATEMLRAVTSGLCR
jgi:hypothetical protein